MKLNVTMTIVNVPSAKEAERIAQNALMELAMNAARRNGSIKGFGSGNAEAHPRGHIVTAQVELSGNGDVHDLIAETQANWLCHNNIASSAITIDKETSAPINTPEPDVEDEEESDTICEACGRIIDEDDMIVVNPETENEYIVCSVCVHHQHICYCDICDTYFNRNRLFENPVTLERDLCPYCGNKGSF